MRQVHPSGPAAVAGCVIGGAGMEHARCTRRWRFWVIGCIRVIVCTVQLDSDERRFVTSRTLGLEASESKFIHPSSPAPPPTQSRHSPPHHYLVGDYMYTPSPPGYLRERSRDFTYSYMYINPQSASFFEFHVLEVSILLTKTNSIRFSLSSGN